MNPSAGGASSELARVVVVGTTGAGKSTFASQLAGILKSPYIELDALQWAANWTPKAPDEFRQLVEQAVAPDRWVVDGNYGIIRDLVWPRATAIVWLNYPFSLVFWRVFRRTIARVVKREELYAGNQESVRKAFLSRDSILWWMVTTYSRRQRQFRALQVDQTFPNLVWLEFRRSSQAVQFLKLLKVSP